MSEQYFTVITDVGAAKLAQAWGSGTPLQITEIGFGDGDGQYVEPDAEQDELVNEVHREDVNRVFHSPHDAETFVVEGWIPKAVGGFTVREVGAFDADGDLILVAAVPAKYKPTEAEGGASDLYFRMLGRHSHADQVAVTDTPTTIFATHDYVDGHIENTSNPHQVTAPQVGAPTIEAFNSVLNDVATLGSALTSHLNATNNPHSTTAAQVGAPPTSRTITAGNGLTGGGNLSQDRTLTVGQGAGISVSSTQVSLDTGHARNVDHDSVSVTAGNGLTGGGTIAANRTLAVGQGTGISVSSTQVGLDTGHARNVDHGAVSISAGNGLTGGGTIAASRTLTVGQGAGISVTSTQVSLDTGHSRNVDHNTVTINAGNGLTGGGTIAASRTVALGTPSTITGSTTNNVTGSSHTHALTLPNAAGGIGTYAMARKMTSGDIFFGDTIAGSDLRASNPSSSGATGDVLSGTWRLMARIANSSDLTSGALFMRIS